VAKYHGKSGLVYLSTTGTGNASSVVGLSSWSLDRSTQNAETTVFGDANKTYVQGLPDLKGSFSGFWDDSETKIFAGAASTDGVKLYLYPSSNRLASYWYGPAWVNASMETGINDAVKVKSDFIANGSWSSQGL
jgi:hypothetical protein